MDLITYLEIKERKSFEHNISHYKELVLKLLETTECTGTDNKECLHCDLLSSRDDIGWHEDIVKFKEESFYYFDPREWVKKKTRTKDS